ncbi:MAG TPA: hypothetical protein VN280_19120, partial [Variovorax sp.]|nr:hypothetical protein [Variovorax sp.]
MSKTQVSPLLRVRGVGKRYGHRVALHDASFDLWPGEVLVMPAVIAFLRLGVLVGLLQVDHEQADRLADLDR